jgi:dTDP-4-amino-4,6-dideoxygalactose transaminase
MQKIPFFGLPRQYQFLKDEILEASDRVYSTGQVLDGKYTRAFENAIAHRCQRKHAIAVNSGTQALVMAQQCIQGEPDQVLIPTLSFTATVNSVLMANNIPVFCDTDNQGLINLESMDVALRGSGVNIIMFVNLFGNMIDWDRFRVNVEFFNNNEVAVIEDAAQSFGAYYKDRPSGSLGELSVLSFDPTKNLPNYGSGGMVLTDVDGLADSLRDLRNNGQLHGNVWAGTNSKMSESDCAQMLVKLRYFDEWQRRRTEIANYYTQQLRELVATPVVSPDVTHAWHKYVIRLSNRHGLKNYLLDKGIETRIHYTKALFELPVSWQYDAYNLEGYGESVAFTRECMSLPIYPELTDAEVEYIVQCVKDYVG